MKRITILVLAIVFTITSCKKDEPLDTQLTVNFHSDYRW